MILLSMRAIWYGANFRHTDMRLYDEFARSDMFPGHLRAGECYLFVAAGENQLLWFLNQQSDRDGEVTFTDTRRWRFLAGTRWEPSKLHEYANLVGIELTGIRKFGQAAEAFREERAERQRQARARWATKQRTQSTRSEW